MISIVMCGGGEVNFPGQTLTSTGASIKTANLPSYLSKAMTHVIDFLLVDVSSGDVWERSYKFRSQYNVRGGWKEQSNVMSESNYRA